MIKACIFDLDGVLVETAHFHFIAWRRMANELGFDFDEKQNEELKGVGRMESLEMILEWGGIEKTPEEKFQLTELKNSWYVDLLKNLSPNEILEGVIPFLDHVKSKGYRIALGSASKNAMTILTRMQLVDRFEVIIDGTKTTRSKPDPQVFQMGAAALGLQPIECIVFEDGPKGVKAGLDGGFFTVGVGQPAVLNAAHMVIPNFVNVKMEDILQQISLAKETMA